MALLWTFEDCRTQFHLDIVKRDSKIVLYSADHELLLYIELADSSE